MKPWYLYCIRCKTGQIYTGITQDVKRRLLEHGGLGKKGAKFLRGKGPLKLLFKRKVGDKSIALKLEYRVKQLSRTQKITLIKTRKLPTLSTT